MAHSKRNLRLEVDATSPRPMVERLERTASHRQTSHWVRHFSLVLPALAVALFIAKTDLHESANMNPLDQFVMANPAPLITDGSNLVLRPASRSHAIRTTKQQVLGARLVALCSHWQTMQSPSSQPLPIPCGSQPRIHDPKVFTSRPPRGPPSV